MIFLCFRHLPKNPFKPWKHFIIFHLTLLSWAFMLGVPDVKSLNPQIRAFLLNLYIFCQVFYLISQTWTPHSCTLYTEWWSESIDERVCLSLAISTAMFISNSSNTASLCFFTRLIVLCVATKFASKPSQYQTVINPNINLNCLCL